VGNEYVDRFPGNSPRSSCRSFGAEPYVGVVSVRVIGYLGSGLYGYDVDRFWQDPNCTAYIATIGGNYAGFALVDDQVKVGGGQFWMDQFGVLKKYQRQGVGRALATYVFLDKIGKWEVGQMPDNDRAQRFWRKTIGDFTAGNYVECQITEGWWQGFVQCFESLPSN
jgi:predicted acetyltransferase